MSRAYIPVSLHGGGAHISARAAEALGIVPHQRIDQATYSAAVDHEVRCLGWREETSKPKRRPSFWGRLRGLA